MEQVGDGGEQPCSVLIGKITILRQHPAIDEEMGESLEVFRESTQLLLGVEVPAKDIAPVDLEQCHTFRPAPNGRVAHKEFQFMKRGSHLAMDHGC